MKKLWAAFAALAFASICSGQQFPITPATLPSGTIGANYQVVLTASGGSGNYHYAVSVGNLPNGFSLTDIGSNPVQGRIAGVPGTGGTTTFTIRVTDQTSNFSSTQQFSLGVMQITTNANLPDATAGSPYTVTCNASDAPPPYTWGAPGAPAGLSMNGNTGVLSGTPSQSGTFTFNVTANSATGNATATKAVNLKIFQPIGLGTQSTLDPVYQNQPYSLQFTANGGKTPYAWAMTGGALPEGLSFTSSGQLFGTPTQAGTFIFSVRVTDSNNAQVTKQFTITVYAPLSFSTTPTLPSASLGLAYKQTVQAAGGVPPYTFGVLPSGLSSGIPPGLNFANTGAITGTPTNPGAYSFIVQVTDSNGAKFSTTFSLTVTQLAITSAPQLPNGQAGVVYNQTLTAAGGTAPYNFAITAGTLPAGLSLRSDGVVSGTPASVGTFNFTVTVTDSSKLVVAQQFQLIVAAAGAGIQVSAATIIFSASAAGDSPPAQYVLVNSTNNAALNFTVTVDGGSSGVPAPAWISVSPKSGTTPARLTVTVDPLALSAGAYAARIRIQLVGSNTFTDISVTNSVQSPPPDVIAYPTYLRFESRVNGPGITEQSLLVVNRGGGGSQAFQVSVVNKSTWLTITPAFGTTAHNAPAVVIVKVSSIGLAAGFYRDAIHFVSPSTTYDIPVTLYIAGPGSLLKVSPGGLQFQVKQGAGGIDPKTVKIYNRGDTGTVISWRADVLQGSQWVSVSPSTGIATTTQPGLLTVVPGQGALSLGTAGYYAVIRITDIAGQSTPQYIIGVLDVLDPNSPSTPDLNPAGLVFRTTGSGAQQSQNITVYTSDTNAVPYQCSAYTSDGLGWLSVAPTTGTATTTKPGTVTVTINPGTLKQGVYTGEVALAMPGGTRIATVTMIISSKAPTAAPRERTADSCTPTQLIVTDLNEGSGFTIKSGFPFFLYVSMYDDCSNPIIGADVVATFTNGDLPLTMFPDPVENVYSAVWQPGSTSSSLSITYTGNTGDLQTAPPSSSSIGASATARDAGAAVNLGRSVLNGTVVANPGPPPPILNPCGVANNTNINSCGGLAPGTVASLYGQNLAPAPPVSPGILPLPTIFNNTQAVVGTTAVPMFYLGPNQINVELPTDLAIGKQYSVIVSNAGGVTVSDPITVTPVSPGVAAQPDGHTIAQHADFTLVDQNRPAKPNEAIAIYLTGLGGTNPTVATGAQSPFNPAATVTNAASITVDNQPASVDFAGLTPGGIGLYQLNFHVPAGARTGDLDLVVSQGGVTSNVTKLRVSQ